MSDRYNSRRGSSPRPYYGRRDSETDTSPWADRRGRSPNRAGGRVGLPGRGDDRVPGSGLPGRSNDRGPGGGGGSEGHLGAGSNRSLLDILSNASPSSFNEPGMNDQPLQFSSGKGPQQQETGLSQPGNKFPGDQYSNMNEPLLAGSQTMRDPMYPGPQDYRGFRGDMPQQMGGDGPMGGMMGGMMNEGGGMGRPGMMEDNRGMGGPMGNMMASNGGMMDQPQGYSSTLQESFWGTGFMVYPGDPNMYVPMPGKRPVGCKTVKFNDIPFNVTEEMVREICEKVAGVVESCEKERGPFCTVRFKDSASVDKIFSVHGMQICVGNNKTPPFAGRLLIDYVRNYSDLRDYDGEQRRIARELRHQQAKAEEAQEVIYFTSPYIEQVTERIKEDTVAGGSINILVTWMERGHCNKKTSRTFYQLIQLTNNHMKRLQVEKIQVEQVLEQARMKYIAAMGSIVMQLTLIEQVFTSATKKKVWDHFTKAQRKSLDQWSQAVKAMRASLEKEVHPEEEAGEADMDIDSDEEEERRRQGKRRVPPPQHPVVVEVIDLSEDDTAGQAPIDMVSSPPEAQSTASKAPVPLEALSTLAPPPPPPEEPPEVPPPEKRIKQDEPTPTPEETTPGSVEEQSKTIEDLRRENDELKARLESKREETTLREKETQIKALQLAFVNMQQQLKESKARLKTEEERRVRETVDGGGVTAETGSPTDPSAEIVREMRDGALMSFMSIFLHAHPFGASIDYLYSYLQRLQPGVTQSNIEQVLQRYPNCFTEELTGVGASIERRWKLIAFDSALSNE